MSNPYCQCGRVLLEVAQVNAHGNYEEDHGLVNGVRQKTFHNKEKCELVTTHQPTVKCQCGTYEVFQDIGDGHLLGADGNWHYLKKICHAPPKPKDYKCYCKTWELETVESVREEVMQNGNTRLHGFTTCTEFMPSENFLVPGMKFDDGKVRWDLLPWAGLEEVAKVLTKGAEKYAPDNWRKVEGWRWRYFRAAIGHLAKWWAGEKNDPEWGYSHLAHAACCVLFMLELDK